MRNIKSYKELFEAVQEYREQRSSENDIRYTFKLNGYRYKVAIWYDSSIHSYKTFEVEFSFDGQKNPSDRARQDLKHLNSVLDTVCEIVEKTVKKYKIEHIKISPSTSEDESVEFYEMNIRSKMYLRYIVNRYGKENVENVGKFINVDMTKVFPDVFGNRGESRIKLVVDELVRLSDENPDREGIERGIDGANEEHFTIDTDFIINSERGAIYITIQVWDALKEYNITWDMMDIGEEGDKYFISFEELLEFLKNFK